MKFTIDRSKWRCGGDAVPSQRGYGDTLMLNDEEFMCCLGQVSKQLGLCEDAIRNAAEPYEIEGWFSQLEGVLLKRTEAGWDTNTQLANMAIGINDNSSISDEDREVRLTQLFAKHGHELEFVGEYVFPVTW